MAGDRMAAKKILILAANPKNLPGLQLDNEVKEIDEGLRRARDREQFILASKLAVTTRDLYRHMLDVQPHIVHFCGHGKGEKGIVLEDNQGRTQPLGTDAIADLFRLFASKGLQCVLLNACYSEVQADAIAAHVPYVIGMSQVISNEAAMSFAVAFYDALGAGEKVEFAFALGCAQLVELGEHKTPVLKQSQKDIDVEDNNRCYEPQQPIPETIGIPHNLPCSNARFVGREQEIETLHQQLQQSDRVAISAIAGMGGVGKTELALQYAQQSLLHHRGGVVWLPCDRAMAELLAFAQGQLFPRFKLADLGDVDVQLAYCWRNWPAQENPPESVLLILDDVTDYQEQVAPYLTERPRFRVLLTTRERLQGIARLDLDVLTPVDALTLLKNIVGTEPVEAEAATAANLCQWLGYLPLGLELAGYYLVEEECSISELLAELEQRRRKVLQHPALTAPEPTMTAQYGVAAAFELSWERLDLDARFLGAYLSLFAAAPIRWQLVVAPGETNAETDEALKTARRKLVRLSLLKKVGQCVQFHPLIRQFFAEKRDSDEFVVPPSHQLTGTTAQILRLFGMPE